MELWAGIGIFLLGAAWVVTSLMCISGMTREWARAKQAVPNYLARNFMPYTCLGLGLMCVGLSPQLIFTNPPTLLAGIGGLLAVAGAPIIIISMVYWPVFLSPRWYRRWYKRGGRTGNNVPLWEPHERADPAGSRTRA